MTEPGSPTAFHDPPIHDLPLPDSWSVREGRDAYLAENAFALDSYDAPWTPASLMGLRFSVPNTQRHRFGIMMHDLHHVATGYGTDPAGEGEISAWELLALSVAELRRILELEPGGIAETRRELHSLAPRPAALRST